MTTETSPLGAPEQVLRCIYEVEPEVLEQFAQWLEQRGIRIPVGQVVGYQRERFGVFLERAATQSIPDSTQTNVIFDTTDSDPQKSFDGTSKVTLPYNGLYLASATVIWAANTTNSRVNILTQNNVMRGEDWRAPTSTAGAAASTISVPILGVKGDAIRHAVFQDCGGALNVTQAKLSVGLISAYG
jgi:hypothetical protein